MIEVKNLEKSFGNLHVLRGITEKIEEQEVVCVIGPSGSGKSTFLRCLNLLEEPTGGEVYLDGEKINTPEVNIDEVREKLGMVFQNFNLFPHMTVLDNITLAPIKVKGESKETAEAKALKLLETVGLDDKAASYPSQLSGGQKQRVAIARALVLDPRFLLCDEATSALDPEITKGILSLLQKINNELGITIIMVTHQMEVVKQICKRVAFLSDGSVLSEGKPEELFVRPTQKEIKSFLREESGLLPTEGVNIQLFFFGEGSEAPVITQMARELDLDLSICWAKLEDFRDSVYGSIVLNIKESDRERVCAFLDEKKVSWEVLD